MDKIVSIGILFSINLNIFFYHLINFTSIPSNVGFSNLIKV